MISSGSYAKNVFLYFACYSAAFLILFSILLVAAYSSVELKPLPVVEYNTFECDTGGDPSFESFNLFAFSKEQAFSLAERLCAEPLVANQFRSIKAIWQHRDIDSLRTIFDQPFELLIAKRESLERPEVNFSDSYVPIAEYRDYSSRLISLESQPQLSNSYFRNKVLGLHHNPSSVSGHKLPRQAIKNANLDESQITYKFYNSHPELYQALLNAEVDVVATGFLISRQQLLERQHFIKALDERVQSPRWYLHPSLNHLPFRCVISTLLDELEPASHSLITNTSISNVHDATESGVPAQCQ